jgi:phosphatidylglycerophosphatase C
VSLADETPSTARGPRPSTGPGAGPVIAAFDFDGTLTRGGSVWQFLVAMRGPVAVARAAAGLLPRLVAAALLGGSHADEAKEALFEQVLAGLPEATIADDAASFGRRHYRRHARSILRRRLEAHRRLGHRLVLVSASPELYLRPLAEELGFDEVVATRLEVDAEGRLTGRYAGANCRGAQKIRRLEAWIADQQGEGDGPDQGHVLWAYGNSAGDRQLLAAATVPVNVGRLGRLGRLRGFPRLREVPPPSVP